MKWIPELRTQDFGVTSFSGPRLFLVLAMDLVVPVKLAPCGFSSVSLSSPHRFAAATDIASAVYITWLFILP
jgi:hypothetical protein